MFLIYIFEGFICGNSKNTVTVLQDGLYCRVGYSLYYVLGAGFGGDVDVNSIWYL